MFGSVCPWTFGQATTRTAGSVSLRERQSEFLLSVPRCERRVRRRRDFRSPPPAQRSSWPGLGLSEQSRIALAGCLLGDLRVPPPVILFWRRDRRDVRRCVSLGVGIPGLGPSEPFHIAFADAPTPTCAFPRQRVPLAKGPSRRWTARVARRPLGRSPERRRHGPIRGADSGNSRPNCDGRANEKLESAGFCCQVPANPALHC